MSNARKPLARQQFRKLERGHTCPGCGLPATAIDQDDARYWYQPHYDDCPHAPSLSPSSTTTRSANT
ncbi:MAG: hypothetical protein JWR85_3813 [Marmoricola sp.]|nr:hypothetical protein [Marmoricola sp.]